MLRRKLRLGSPLGDKDDKIKEDKMVAPVVGRSDRSDITVEPNSAPAGNDRAAEVAWDATTSKVAAESSKVPEFQMAADLPVTSSRKDEDATEIFHWFLPCPPELVRHRRPAAAAQKPPKPHDARKPSQRPGLIGTHPRVHKHSVTTAAAKKSSRPSAKHASPAPHAGLMPRPIAIHRARPALVPRVGNIPMPRPRPIPRPSATAVVGPPIRGEMPFRTPTPNGYETPATGYHDEPIPAVLQSPQQDREDLRAFRELLNGHCFLGINSHADALAKSLMTYDSARLSRLFASLGADDLKLFDAALNPGRLGTGCGLSESEKTSLFDDLGRKLDGAQLVRLSDALTGNDKETLGVVVAKFATEPAKLAYVKGLASETTKPLARATTTGTEIALTNPAARGVAHVIANLTGPALDHALASLDDNQLEGMMKAAHQQIFSERGHFYDMRLLESVVNAVDSKAGPEQKGRVFEAGLKLIDDMHASYFNGIVDTDGSHQRAIDSLRAALWKGKVDWARFADEKYLQAALEDTYGQRKSSDGESGTVRILKLVAGGVEWTLETSQDYRGGRVVVELRKNAKSSVGRGASVEANVGPTVKQITGGPFTGQPDSGSSSTFAEFIYRTHQGNYGDGTQYLFPDLASANEFTRDFAGKASYLSAYKAEFGLRKELDTAYDKFADEHKFADKFAAEYSFKGGPMGSFHELGYSPFGFKLYWSGDPSAFLSNRATGNAVPQSWRDTLITSWVGYYAEAGCAVQGNVGESQQNINAPQIASTDDVNPNADKAWNVWARGDCRSLLAFSNGTQVPLGRLDEVSTTAGGGVIFDPSDHWAQSYFDFKWVAGRLDGGEQSFRDWRLNRFGLGEGAQVNGVQALNSRLGINTTTTDYAYRWDFPVLTEDGKPSTHSADVLLHVYQNELEAAAPHERFKEFGDLFKPAWERKARRAYESTFNHGNKLTEEEWSQVLSDNLTRSWTNSVSDVLGAQSMRYWRSDFITPERVDAYNDKWQELAKKRLADKKLEIERMQPYQIYDTYIKDGLSQPGMYVRIWQGHTDQTTLGAGVSIANPGRMKTLALANRVDPFSGLFQIRDTQEHKGNSQVANLAMSHAARTRFSEIDQDPLSRPAYIALMNRYGYSRKTPSGDIISPSPLSGLVDDGTTPTRMIEYIQERTGRRDFSRIPGVYIVRAQDRTFDDIGRNSLEQLGAVNVSQQEAHAYGALIRRLNFEGLADSEIKDRVFENATLLLLTPGQFKSP
jgi:hypothetical protein